MLHNEIEYIINTKFKRGCELFYRGQADRKWSISSGINRNEYMAKDGTHAPLYIFEDDLLNTVIRHYPDEFRGLSSLEKLSKLQHYGLPTRLIDITRSIFVAAYFACVDNAATDKDGAIYLIHGEPLLPDDEKVIEYTDLCFRKKDAPQYNPSFLVNPNYGTPRIREQQGAFILEYNPEDIKKMVVDDVNIIIPAEHKKVILRQLYSIGIEHHTLFPELMSMTKSVKDHYVQEIRDTISHVSITFTN